MNRAVPKLQANPNVYGIPGKVLQIDGDKEYLKNMFRRIYRAWNTCSRCGYT